MCQIPGYIRTRRIYYYALSRSVLAYTADFSCHVALVLELRYLTYIRFTPIDALIPTVIHSWNSVGLRWADTLILAIVLHELTSIHGLIQSRVPWDDIINTLSS